MRPIANIATAGQNVKKNSRPGPTRLVPAPGQTPVVAARMMSHKGPEPRNSSSMPLTVHAFLNRPTLPPLRSGCKPARASSMPPTYSTSLSEMSQVRLLSLLLPAI